MAGAERIARLAGEKTFESLATSKKRDPKAKAADKAAGRAEQDAIRALLCGLPGKLFLDRADFQKALGKAAKAAGGQLEGPLKKAILSALSEPDQRRERIANCPESVSADRNPSARPKSGRAPSLKVIHTEGATFPKAQAH